MDLKELIKKSSIFSGIMIIFHFVIYFIESSLFFDKIPFYSLKNLIHFIDYPSSITLSIFNSFCPREDISGMVIPSCIENYTLVLSASVLLTIILLFVIYFLAGFVFLYIKKYIKKNMKISRK